MEKRQLDLNAPLLSARRYSSPSHSSELVKRKVLEKHSLPSRQQSLPLNKSDWESDLCKPAAVPFHWEKIPGRPKDQLECGAHTPKEESSNTPKLPPGRLSGPLRFSSGERSNDQNIYRPHIEAFAFSDHASLLEKLNESLNCKDESDSGSEEDAYSDALDMLSPNESWSWNYSVSGLSGYHSSGVKPSGTFCIDAQTRDFMMNRFLPAAKAAVLETPQYVAKKQQQQVINERPKPLRKAFSGEIKPSLKQYGSDALPYYSQYIIDNAESEDEKDCKVTVKKSGKAWGILPKFCVKNALCLLNPLPGMKSKSRTPTPSTHEVRRLTRNAHSGPLDKNPCHVPINQKKFHSGLLPRDLSRIENKLTNDSNQLRRYRSGNISPYRNESPKSPFREGVGFLGVPKEVESFNASKIASSRKLFKALQDVSKNQINERGSGPTGDHAVEKTVYIDSIKRKYLPISKSSCTKADEVVDFSTEKPKVLDDSRQMGENCAVKYDQDPSSPNILDEVKKLSPKFGSTDKVQPSLCADGVEDVKLNGSLEQELETKEEQKLESDNRRESVPLLKSPLPPPLPKSPSESWLWRTLPSISIGNPFAHSRRISHLQSKKQGQKGPASDNAKWETIVKTSNLRHDHVRYSEELIPHASHRQSKS